MWTQGATASQIAEELGGVSRNAVIGKAHRLGLESRPSPVKAGEEKEKKAKAGAGAEGRQSHRRPEARACRGRTPGDHCRGAPVRGAELRRPSQSTVRCDDDPVSLGRTGRLHPPGTRRHAGADPAGSAAPPGSGQAIRGSGRQDIAARPERPRLPLADGPSGRARFPLLRTAVQPRLSLLRRALRRRLPGAAAPPRSPPAAATAIRWAESSLTHPSPGGNAGAFFKAIVASSTLGSSLRVTL